MVSSRLSKKRPQASPEQNIARQMTNALPAYSQNERRKEEIKREEKPKQKPPEPVSHP